MCAAQPVTHLYHSQTGTIVADGTLWSLTNEQCHFFVRFVASVFKYLDHFYMELLALPDVTTMLHAALPFSADV